MQVGYAQTTAFGSVVLIASTVYTEFSGRSWTSKFDRKVGLFFGALSLPFDVKGFVMDFRLIQHAVYEGAPAQTVLVAQMLVGPILRMRNVSGPADMVRLDHTCGHPKARLVGLGAANSGKGMVQT